MARYVWVALTAAMLVALTGEAADAAEGKSASIDKRSPIQWSAVAHWPDFTSGMWLVETPKPQGGQTPAAGAPVLSDPDAIPAGVVLTPQAQVAHAALKRTEGDSTNCIPTGPLTMRILPIGIFYAGDSIFFITDMDDFLVRRVIMNRKDHGDPDPTWSGHSIGHWEGATLVVDTVAIEPQIKLLGLPSGGNLHIVERIRLTKPNELEWNYTITDPELLAKPYEITDHLRRHKGWELQAASCAEGNRDIRKDDGSASVNFQRTE